MTSFRKFLINIIFDRSFKEKVNFLKQVSLFSDLSARALGKVVSIMHVKHYAKNDIVFNEGQEGKVFYIVKSGEVAVTKGNRVVFKLGPGSFFGEMALLEEMPRTATIVAGMPTELYLIYKIKFDEMIDYNPGVGVRIVRALASILSERLRETMENQPAEVSQGNTSCKG